MGPKLNVIAVDGPAGSGKSTVAKKVAQALGFLYIDTGAMYRALTLKAIRHNIDLNDQPALVSLANNTDIRLASSAGGINVFLDGEDVSEEIRKLYVSDKVKFVACVEGVRAKMVRMQRSLGDGPKGACLEGRDIGTVVFPDAKFKFYLDASFDERVRRRLVELQEKGMKVTREEVAADLAERDRTDISRKVGPLKKADDALLVDTTSMTIDGVTEFILKRVNYESHLQDIR